MTIRPEYGISLLGGTEIRSAGSVTTALSTRAVALLGLLISRADTPQPRSHLAALLWPESTEAQARTNLRRELHLLRSVLGPRSDLYGEGQQLVWRSSDRWQVDVLQFRAATARGLAAIDRDEPRAVAEAADAVLAGYTGRFLPGILDDWAVEARDQLHSECVAVCARIARYFVEHADPAAAMACARRRVHLAPLEESGYRQLVQIQISIGDRGGALTTIHQCASRLEEELGVAPGPQLRQMYDALLADASAGGRGAGTEPPGAGGSAEATAPGMPPLVGRRAERAALLAAWTQAPRGLGLLLVTGDPGVGKSRLVAELAGRVRRGDGVVATARCFAATAGLPLAPVAAWLRAPQVRPAIRRLDPVWRTEAERLVPAIGSPQPTPDAAARAKVDAWRRLRFFEGLARALAAVGRPVLLTLDDLQWCDRATLSWLSFLLSWHFEVPILVVATARAGELGRGPLAEPLRAIRRAGRLQLLRLPELDPSDTRQLIMQVLGRPVDRTELDLVGSVAGGNPLYLIEALRALAAAPGRLLPADLRGVLDQRLADLPAAAHDITDLAAAVGRAFPLDLMIEASDLPETEVVAMIDLLWRHRILRQQGDHYLFAHELLRTAAYAAIGPARRRLVHRRLARALQLTGDTDTVGAAEVAEQYARGGQAERALPFFVRAARQACAVFAHDEGVRLWDRALEVLRTLPAHRGRDEQELAMLVERLPPLHAFRGYTAPGMEQSARRVAELAAGLDRPPDRATGLITLWATVFVSGRTAESLGLGRTVLAATSAMPALAAQGHLTVAGAALSSGLLAEADDHFRAACELAGETDSLPMGTRTAVHARAWWAHLRFLVGDAGSARSHAEDAIRAATRIEHPYSLAVALAYAAVTWQLLADRDRLATTVGRLRLLCERYRFAYYGEWGRVLDGWLQGGPSGLATIRSGIDALIAEDALARMPYWLTLLADVHRRTGDATAARGVLDAAACYLGRNGEPWWSPELLRIRAGLSDHAAAEAGLRRAVRLATAQGSVTFRRRAERDLAALRGQPGHRTVPERSDS